MVLLFMLEKVLLSRNAREVPLGVHGRAGFLIVIGDAFHSLVDGTVLAAAFLTAAPLGINGATAQRLEKPPATPAMCSFTPQVSKPFQLRFTAGRTCWRNATPRWPSPDPAMATSTHASTGRLPFT